MTEYRRAGMGEHGWWPRISSLVDGDIPDPLYVAPTRRRQNADSDSDNPASEQSDSD